MRSTRHRRRGYTLTFFAMFLFGFMALAALVIDLGFARLTQRQMQTATDSGALEGLRGEGMGEGTVDYVERREAARQQIVWHFDDNLDASDGDAGAFGSETGQFGAGPLVNFSGGVGDPSLSAGQLLEVDPGNPVHKPQVLDGAKSGDGSFQVTLRRGAEDVAAADLYSDGPAVPYLFARGSLADRQAISNGMTVRATSVAGSDRVVSIGMAERDITPPLLGLTPFALELSYWNSLAVNLSETRTALDGRIQAEMDGETREVGHLFPVDSSDMTNTNSELAKSEMMPVSIGRAIPAATAIRDRTYTGYVPIYQMVSGEGEERPLVVGFGRATAVVTTMEIMGGTSQTVEITKHESIVASENASAVFCHRLDESVRALIPELLSAREDIDNPLRAPVLRGIFHDDE